MLTPDQEKYLKIIPEDKKTIIQDFNPAVKVASDEVVVKIKAEKPDWNVWPMGSSELGIAGQNDIDINIPIHPEEIKGYLPELEKLFGPPRQKEKLPMKWELNQDGFEVELYLTDSTTKTFQEHLDVFTMLKENAGLRARYEEIKKSSNGGSFREYMKKKYEFFNKILENSKGKSAAVGECDDFGK